MKRSLQRRRECHIAPPLYPFAPGPSLPLSPVLPPHKVFPHLSAEVFKFFRTNFVPSYGAVVYSFWIKRPPLVADVYSAPPSPLPYFALLFPPRKLFPRCNVPPLFPSFPFALEVSEKKDPLLQSARPFRYDSSLPPPRRATNPFFFAHVYAVSLEHAQLFLGTNFSPPRPSSPQYNRRLFF